MSNKHMEAELRRLECLFTWGVEKSDIKDSKTLKHKLHDRIRFCPQKYHGTYYNLLAFVSHLEGETENALEHLHKAQCVLKEEQRKDDELLVTFSSLAWVYYYLRRLNDAQDYLNKVRSVCNDSCNNPAVHGEKGWSFLRLGGTYYQRAKESFNKALEAEPNNTSLNVGYAVVLYRIDGMNKAGDSGGVVEQLRKALNLEPTNSEIMVLLALKLQKTRTQEARTLIKEALRLSPDVPQVTRYVAKYFRAEGSIEDSLCVLKRAVELAPNSSFIHHQIGLCKKQQLIQMFEERRSGRRVPVALTAAKATECIRHFSKAVELKPDNIYAKVNLAEAYGESRGFEEAEKIFNSLMDDKSLSESEKQHCHTCYGSFLFYKKKDEDKAVGQFKAAFMIPVDGYERKQACKKLKMIAERNISARRKVREAYEILAFISSEETQETQEKDHLRRAQHSSDTDELSEDFAKGLKL